MKNLIIILLFFLTSCSAILEKATDIGVEIVRESVGRSESKKAYEIEFPAGSFSEEKFSWWQRLFGRTEQDMIIHTACYRVEVIYSNSKIYYSVYTNPSKIKTIIHQHGILHWSIRKDSYKGRDINETMYMTDSKAEKYEVTRTETDDVRKWTIKKCPVVVYE